MHENMTLIVWVSFFSSEPSTKSLIFDRPVEQDFPAMQTIEVSFAPYIGPRCGQNYSIMGTLQSWSVAVDNIRSEVLPLPNLFIKPRTQRHAVSPAFLSFHATHYGGPERRLLWDCMKHSWSLRFCCSPVHVPLIWKTNKLVGVTRHQRQKWKSGNPYRSMDTRRGGTVLFFSMPVTLPARTGTVNGSFSHTHTLTHLHSKALFFFLTCTPREYSN